MNQANYSLCFKLNVNYAMVITTNSGLWRYKSSTLELPKLVVARKNLFYDWLSSKNKLGGQNKVPRLSNSREFIEELISMN